MYPDTLHTGMPELATFYAFTVSRADTTATHVERVQLHHIVSYLSVPGGTLLHLTGRRTLCVTEDACEVDEMVARATGLL